MKCESCGATEFKSLGHGEFECSYCGTRATDPNYKEIKETDSEYVKRCFSSIDYLKTNTNDEEINKLQQKKFENHYQVSGIKDEEKIIQTANSYLLSHEFSKAIKEFEKATYYSNAKAYYGKFLASMKATNDVEIPVNASKIKSFDDFHKAITYSKSVDEAKAYIEKLKIASFNLLANDDIVNSYNIFKELYKWQILDLEDLKTSFYEALQKNENANDINTVFDDLSKLITSKNTYIECHLSVAKHLLELEDFNNAKKYYNKVLVLNSNDPEALFGVFLANNHANSNNIHDHLNVFDIKQIDSIAKASNNMNLNRDLIEISFKLIDNNKVDLGLKLFENIIVYLNAYQDIKTDLTMHLANKLLSNEKYDNAKKYFALLTTIDTKNPKAYLGLLLSKLKLKTKYDLVLSSKPLTNYDEFQRILHISEEVNYKYMKLVSDQIRCKNEKKFQNEIKDRNNKLKKEMERR